MNALLGTQKLELGEAMGIGELKLALLELHALGRTLASWHLGW